MEQLKPVGKNWYMLVALFFCQICGYIIYGQPIVLVKNSDQQENRIYFSSFFFFDWKENLSISHFGNTLSEGDSSNHHSPNNRSKFSLGTRSLLPLRNIFNKKKVLYNDMEESGCRVSQCKTFLKVPPPPQKKKSHQERCLYIQLGSWKTKTKGSINYSKLPPPPRTATFKLLKGRHSGFGNLKKFLQKFSQKTHTNHIFMYN